MGEVVSAFGGKVGACVIFRGDGTSADTVCEISTGACLFSAHCLHFMPPVTAP